jgi:hypothetical protein
MAVNTPVLVRVRQRLTRHTAEDPDAPAKWREHFRVDQVSRRQRDEALPLHRRPPTRADLLKELFGVEDDE